MEIGSNDWSNLIIEGARTFDVDLDRRHTEQFATHAKELVKWTQKINITTITDALEVATKHFLDSLAPARFITPGAELLDIGSGGGFPGIPLKIVIPSLSLTLIDASRKKVNFIKHLIRMLKLDTIETLHIRAEELVIEPVYANRFDVIISRALSALDALVSVALPLLAEEGVIIALKGKVDQKQLPDLRRKILEKTEGRNAIGRPLSMSITKYRLPYLDSTRSIVIVRRHA